MSNLSNKVKAFRISKGMTQKQLADTLNVSQNAIYNWENGKRDIKIETLQKIADALEVPLYELLASSDIVSITNENDAIKAGAVLDQIHAQKVASAIGEADINKYYSMLNSKGKQLAVDFVEGLAGNPKYKAAPTDSVENDFHKLTQAEENIYASLDNYRNDKYPDE